MVTRKFLQSVALLIAFIFLLPLATRAQSVSFNLSLLQGSVSGNPTTLQFGPDGRLYVGQKVGWIRVYTIIRAGENDYQATAVERIDFVHDIKNHDDDGALNTGEKNRQVTGLVVTGAAANPVLYVSSSDPRVGGNGGAQDTNLDTNSGVVTRLTWNGSSWDHVDLVRGLPRSEENHASNGMSLSVTGDTLFLASGGHTNAGAPSNNFAFLTEYALAGAILSIDLAVIEAMPTQFDAEGTAYKYDIPTLDDPTRPNANGIDDPASPGYDGIDAGDPFGGNDGLNQAKLVPGGPVQIYSPGWRNPYDVTVLKTPGREGRIYSIDNGANGGWGGHPMGEGPSGVCTNDYDPLEPGSGGPGPNDDRVNNLDNLHFISGEGYYAGHPAPVRGNPDGAGLYTFDGTGMWRILPQDLPVDWPPVSTANPVECDFRNPGVDDGALYTINASTNGLVEYPDTSFGGTMQGDLLAASFDGNLYRIKLNAGGDAVTSVTTLASNFGDTPLDVTAQGPDDIFPGTIWVTSYITNGIHIFEPNRGSSCSAAYSDVIDDDDDNYSNADEIDNASDPCSQASKPPDRDGDFLSDLNDDDDDNDGLFDHEDAFAIDADNGAFTGLPLVYPLLNEDPGFGFFGLGFTGLMTNGTDDYQSLYVFDNLIAGGTAGLFTISDVGDGDATGSTNTQQDGFQFGVDIDASSGTFTAQARLSAPFFGSTTPTDGQSQGMFIGTGDQDNYLKIVLHANGGNGGIQVLFEDGGFVTSSTMYGNNLGGEFFIPDNVLTATEIDLFLTIDPGTGQVQPSYSLNGGSQTTLGQPFPVSGALLSALQSSAQVAAVGIIATTGGSGVPFTAIWDEVAVVTPGALISSTPNLDFGTVFLGSSASDALMLTSTSTDEDITITDLTLTGDADFALDLGFSLPHVLGPGEQVQVDLAFTPGSTGIKAAVLEVTHDGANNPLQIDVSGQSTDPSSGTGTWTTIVSSSEPRARYDNGYAEVNGKFYLVGGRGNRRTFEYDPVANTWLKRALPPIQLHHFQAVVYNGLLYVVGAYTDSFPNETPVTHIYIYNPATDNWSQGAEIPVARRRGAAGAVLYNGKIYLVGGGGHGTQAQDLPWFDAFDPVTETWQVLPDAPRPRNHTRAAVVGDKLYFLGGSAGGANNPIAEVDVHDFTTGQWSTLPAGANLPTPRSGVATAVLGSEILVIGGESGGQALAHDETEALDVTTNTWRALAPMNQGRHNTQALVHNGVVYIAAGSGDNGGSTELSDQEMFEGGDGASMLVSTPTAVNFGQVIVSSTAAEAVMLTNNGATDDITLTDLTLTGDADFALDLGFSLPHVLGPGEQVQVDLDFTPASAGAKAAVLEVTHDGVNTPLQVALDGEGFEEGPSALAATPATVDFGQVIVGSTAAEAVMLTNNGATDDITLTDLTLTGDADFALDLGFSLPHVLGPGEQVQVDLDFTPASAGAKAAVLEVTHDGTNNPLQIDVSGQSTDPGSGTGTWTAIVSPSEPRARHENGYAEVNGKFYLVGGRGNRRTFEYDPVANTWLKRALPPFELHHFQAVVYNDLIYVAGAYTEPFPTETAVSHMYIYDPAANSWSQGPEIPAARQRGSTGTVLYNGKIYLVGGSIGGHGTEAQFLPWFDAFDPVTETWQVLPDAPRPRDHTRAEVIGDKLYFLGGSIEGANNPVVEVDVYDFTTGQWSTLPAGANLPTPRSGVATAVLGNEILVIGGESGSQQPAHDETEALNVTTNTWRTLAPLNQGRHGTQAIVYDGSVYIAAGSGEKGGGPELSDQEMYLSGGTGPSALAAAPTAVDFGQVIVSSTAAEAVMLTNNGATDDITLTDLTLTGDADFALDLGFSLPHVLGPGEQVQVDLDFTPASAGAKTATLEVTHDGTNNPLQIALDGEGAADTNTLAAAPTAVDFGTAIVGSTAAEAVMLTNNGATDDITLTDLTLTGDADFALDLGFSLPHVLGPGEQVQVDLAFTPASAGAKAAVLEVTHDGDNTPLQIDVSGLGSDPGSGTGTWTAIVSPSEPRARYENGYAEIDGLFYLVGGRGNRRTEIYDPVANTWDRGSFPPIELHHFQAVTYNGLIYAAGAYTGKFPNESEVMNMYLYDPATDSWSQGPEIPQSRNRGSAGAVRYDGKIYLVGGSQGGDASSQEVAWFDAFDPVTETWQALPDAPRARSHTNAQVIGDKLYFLGGSTGGGNNPVAEVDVYDFTTGQWSTLPAGANLPTPRSGTATAVLGNEILVIGGENQPTAYDVTEALDVTTNTWRTLASLNTGRHGTQAIVYDGSVYLAAGTNGGNSGQLSSQERFEFSSGVTASVLASEADQPELAARQALAGGITVHIEDAAGATQTLYLADEWADVAQLRSLEAAAGKGETSLDARFENNDRIAVGDNAMIIVQSTERPLTIELSGLPEGEDYVLEEWLHGWPGARYSMTEGRRVEIKDQQVTTLMLRKASEAADVPIAFTLEQNYPNPFNPLTRIRYALPEAAHVTLQIFDPLGRVLTTLVNEEQGEGRYTVSFDASRYSSGVYFYRIEAGNYVDTKRMTLLK